MYSTANDSYNYTNGSGAYMSNGGGNTVLPQIEGLRVNDTNQHRDYGQQAMNDDQYFQYSRDDYNDGQRPNYASNNGVAGQQRYNASPYNHQMAPVDQSFDSIRSPVGSRPAMTSSQQDIRGAVAPPGGYYAPGVRGQYPDDRFSDRESSVANPLDERFSEAESSVMAGSEAGYDARFAGSGAPWRLPPNNTTFVKEPSPHSPHSPATLNNAPYSRDGPTPQPGSLFPPLRSPDSVEVAPYRAPSVTAAPVNNRLSPAVAGSQIIDSKWRNPDLREVIDYLSHENDAIKANAAAYLQHLSYMDDNIKAQTRVLRGIPALVDLVNHPVPEVHRSACGALRNLSYGKANDENKRDIKNASGITVLVRLLRTTRDNDVRELVTGVLWNLSSCQDLKKFVIDDGLKTIVDFILKPAAGFTSPVNTSVNSVNISQLVDDYRSTVFRNASGIIRNVSSDGIYARQRLRECDGLIDTIYNIVNTAISRGDMDNKSIENCVCVLRNLSYACQEVIDPNYLQKRNTNTTTAQGDSVGCFGGKKNKKSATGNTKTSTNTSPVALRGDRGVALLWNPIIIRLYMPLLRDCTNPDTLEAAAGAIQNLAAGDWQPAADIRTAVRQEKCLTILCELLALNSDRVVCAAATALRNLALDAGNKELIGKYAMAQLVHKLPSDDRAELILSNDTIAAVEAALYEIIKTNSTHAKSLMSEQGVERLMFIVRSEPGVFNQKVVRFASQLLQKLWSFSEFHVEYKAKGWKQSDFTATNTSGRSLPASADNTINRPHMGQSGPANANTLHIDRQHQPPPYPYLAGSTSTLGQTPGYNTAVRDFNRDSMQQQQQTRSTQNIPLSNMRFSTASQAASYHGSDPPELGRDPRLVGYDPRGYISRPPGYELQDEQPPGYGDVRPLRDDDRDGYTQDNRGYTAQDLRAYADAGRDDDRGFAVEQHRNYPPSAHGDYMSGADRYPAGDVSFDSQTAAHAGTFHGQFDDGRGHDGRYDAGIDRPSDPLAVRVLDPYNNRTDGNNSQYPPDRSREPVYAHVQRYDNGPLGGATQRVASNGAVNDVDSWV